MEITVNYDFECAFNYSLKDRSLIVTVLEVILRLSQQVMSNYINHIAENPSRSQRDR